MKQLLAQFKNQGHVQFELHGISPGGFYKRGTYKFRVTSEGYITALPLIGFDHYFKPIPKDIFEPDKCRIYAMAFKCFEKRQSICYR